MRDMPASHRGLLLAVCAATCACVVPAGPEWVDPAGNSPPSIQSASPPVGSVLSSAVDADQQSTVEVYLADRNTKDNLYIRWIIDYPPFDDAITRLAPPYAVPGNGEVVRPVQRFAPSCTVHDIAPGFKNHRLMLAVSDRAFTEDPRQPDQVQNGNFRIEAVWLLELECP